MALAHGGVVVDMEEKEGLEGEAVKGKEVYSLGVLTPVRCEWKYIHARRDDDDDDHK